jgi:nucleoside-diphosphate-sugar epimerase
MKSEKKILVTGGAGYIGSVLSEKILSQDYQLVIFDNFIHTTDGIKNIENHPNLEIINGDLRNIVDWKNAIEGVDTIIHLAGISDGRSGKRSPELTLEVNQASFPLLVEEAKRSGVSRFVLASTFGVYGNQYNVPLTEDLPINPVDPYSQSKAFGEEILRKNNSLAFTTTILRIAMVCGVSQRMRFDFIVNQMVIKALTEKKLTILGGKQRRPQIHIRDVTDILLHMIAADKGKISGEVYNIGGENPSISEIADTICQKINDVKLEFLPARKDEDSFSLNSEKFRSKFGIEPLYTIEKAIEEIIDFLKAGNWKDIDEKKYYN